jgi:hypothetical protein
MSVRAAATRPPVQLSAVAIRNPAARHGRGSLPGSHDPAPHARPPQAPQPRSRQAPASTSSSITPKRAPGAGRPSRPGRVSRCRRAGTAGRRRSSRARSPRIDRLHARAPPKAGRSAIHWPATSSITISDGSSSSCASGGLTWPTSPVRRPARSPGRATESPPSPCSTQASGRAASRAPGAGRGRKRPTPKSVTMARLMPHQRDGGQRGDALPRAR